MQLSATLNNTLTRLSGLSRSTVTAVSVLLLIVMLAGTTLLYISSLSATRTIPGLMVGDTVVGGTEFSRLEKVIQTEARKYGEKELVLTVGSRGTRAARQALGAEVDVTLTAARLKGVGRSGSFMMDLIHRVQARRHRLRVPLAVTFQRRTALAFFTNLKARVDRAPSVSRLDMEKRKVLPGSDGYQLRVYDSMAAAELAIHSGAAKAPLAVTIRKAGGDSDAYKDLDISHVMATFSTAYSLKVKAVDRGHNLKVGASRLDGKVLRPGEQLSFNTTVGPRTESHGYRMAGVISEGELVDGMAGGSCQLSSTLFAASFFAGMDLISSRPHTRPSSYIKMGLDATVSYPSTDMVIKNPYPFPVVLHFKVNQGRVTVRILGKERPWRKVVFEREVKEETPFKTVERADDRVPRGKRMISQRGVPGFTMERRRLLFAKGKEPSKIERRTLRYPATTQYIRVGTGPEDPNWKPKKKVEPFGKVDKEFSMER